MLAIALVTFALSAEPLHADLLIVGGDEAGCAAAVQAARLGVKNIVLVSDCDWLGGQFSTQGVGPMDEWTVVAGKRVNFPRSGTFLEIVQRIRAHNRATYGTPTPGNSWCGTETIEPRAAARIFHDWIEDHPQIRVLRGWHPVSVATVERRVTGVTFAGADPQSPAALTVLAKLTVDSSDWGDVIRLSGADYMAGPDLKSRFGEPSAPETLEPGGRQEMNPLSWCPLLRETGRESVIAKPPRYDARSFAEWQSAPTWVDWDGSGGIYNSAGWCIYTHRRIIDRRHFGFAPNTEAVILNWPAQDYPLGTLPAHVVAALEKTERGASLKNIVDMTPAERRIVYDDARQRALEFVHWLQTDAHNRAGDHPASFRYMQLADDYGTADQLPPKPYIREGLRLEALYVLREQDVRTNSHEPRWAKVMVPDGIFGYQFNMDFHPTRRKFIGDDPAQPWQGKFFGARNWNADTDRAMFPLRGLVPVSFDGLLGCSKNIGVTSMVQSSLRLHGQMMHVGSAVGALAAASLKHGVSPREIAESPYRIREIQRTLLRGAGGPGTLLWPWQDVAPDDAYFEAANLLTIAGIWRAPHDGVFFEPRRTVTRAELAGALARLIRATSTNYDWPNPAGEPKFSDVPLNHPERRAIEAMIGWGDFGTQPATFDPDGPVTWGALHRWLVALKLPAPPALAHPKHRELPLDRGEVVVALDRVLKERGELFSPDARWLEPTGDHDGDGRQNLEDPLPFDRNNDNVPDRLQTH